MADSMPATARAVPLVDYFIEEGGVAFAGRHLLIDLWGAEHLTDIAYIERALRDAAAAADAAVLKVDLHQFSDSGGVSGVAILAESHISIHTWPERDFAALDVFMCGKCDPYDSLPALKTAFNAETAIVNEKRRGVAV